VRPEEHPEAGDEGELRLVQLLEAAGAAAAMPEASDGDQAPDESLHLEKIVIDSVVENTVVVETDMAIDEVEEELALPNMRRFSLFSLDFPLFFFSFVEIRIIDSRNSLMLGCIITCIFLDALVSSPVCVFVRAWVHWSIMLIEESKR